jgi:2,5-diketo-D-gluconate reductase B
MKFIQFQGQEIPKIGLGTWGMRGSECRQAVENALSIGYRHLDTAEIYGNETEVGEAISNSKLDREQIFLTTKVWKSHLKHDDLIQACRQSRKKLAGSYVDLYLIHAPNPLVPIQETLDAMNELVETGEIKYIGVSNFTIDQLQEAIQYADIPIFTNQIKYHPLHAQDEMVEFCQKEEILITAYSPLAKGEVGRSTLLQHIAEKHSVTPAQVALRWLVEQDFVITIPKASNPDHQKDNLDIFGFELSSDEVEEIRQLA